MAKRKHKYESSFEEIGKMLNDAAETGQFIFEAVPYADFIAFLKEHAPNFKIQFGAVDPGFKEELKRLGNLAASLD